MNRRKFISGALAGAALRPLQAFASPSQAERDASEEASVSFETSDPHLSNRYQSALDLLASNIQHLPGYAKPVLIEGSEYHGIWLECAPQEGLVYSAIHPKIARNNHMAFFALQHEDGQLPCSIKASSIGYGQIQMVVPIAATAWELAQKTNDAHLLEATYTSCARWDAWLRRYRDTRHTGLCEGFCTYDTGHDNSPRWAGIPNTCPDHDARNCPPLPRSLRNCLRRPHRTGQHGPCTGQRLRSRSLDRRRRNHSHSHPQTSVRCR